MNERGLSLTEVMVAASLVAVVALSLAITDANRGRIETQIRTNALSLLSQTPAGAAMTHIVANVEEADRLKVVQTGITGIPPTGTVDQGLLQFRRVTCPTPPPAPSCYDTAANFTWWEYRLNGTRLEFLQNNGGTCGTPLPLAEGVSALTFKYRVDPGMAYNNTNIHANVLEYAIEWSDGTQTRTYHSDVTARAIPNSLVGGDPAGTGDSGVGLDTSGVSGPPAQCP